MNEKIDEAVLTLLTVLEEKRREEHVGPEGVLTWQGTIQAQIKLSFGRLRKKGLVQLGDTINDKYVKIN